MSPRAPPSSPGSPARSAPRADAPSPAGYDFWLLDLDGTLVDVEAGYRREVLEAVGDRLGHGFDDAEIDVLWYGLGGERDRLLGERGIDPDRFWRTFHEVEEPVARAEATYLYPDAGCVTDLDGPVGLVTHCQQRLTDAVLDRLDVRDWFDTVVCCSDELGWKPDPGPVRAAMGDLRVADGRAGALVGDDPADVGAARNTGLEGVHIERGDPHERGRCVLGDRRIASLAELA